MDLLVQDDFKFYEFISHRYNLRKQQGEWNLSFPSMIFLFWKEDYEYSKLWYCVKTKVSIESSFRPWPRFSGAASLAASLSVVRSPSWLAWHHFTAALAGATASPPFYTPPARKPPPRTKSPAPAWRQARRRCSIPDVPTPAGWSPPRPATCCPTSPPSPP